MRKHINKIIAGIVIVIVLAIVYWWGGDSSGLRGWNPQPDSSSISETQSPVLSQTVAPESIENTEEEVSEIPIKEDNEPSTKEIKPQKQDNTPMTAALPEPPQEETEREISDTAGQDKYQTEPTSEGKPAPIEPENAVISDKQLTCTMSIRCDTVLNNTAWLDAEKVELVPKDGVIYAEQTVTFYEGESVFNLLVREMKRNKIHMEFENTPIYNSAYIEGIGNLYEFDCGELSGWMYKVNDWFPNYGCSRYQLREGDKVEWVYTCDLGRDVGGYYGARNGR